MDFSTFQLKKARKILIHSDPSFVKNQNRRNFLRTMGAGVLAWHPLTKTVKTIVDQSFEFLYSPNRFAVIRHGNVAWELSSDFFERGFHLDWLDEKDHFRLSAANLKVNHVPLEFSLIAEIYPVNGLWMIDLIVPELHIHKRLDFIQWLDGKARVEGNLDVSERNLPLNQSDKISWTGNLKLAFDAAWSMSLTGKHQICLYAHKKKYRTHQLIIKPVASNAEYFIKGSGPGDVILTLPGFAGWKTYLSNLKFYDGNQIESPGDQPDLCVIIGLNPGHGSQKVLWVTVDHGTLIYRPCADSTEKFVYRNYLYVAEYRGEKTPEFYMAGSMGPTGQWITGNLGSMKFISNDKYPDIELFGQGDQITWHICESRLQTFHPLVQGAVALPVSLSQPLPVRINPASLYAGISGGHEQELVSDAGFGTQEPPGRKKPSNIYRQTNEKALPQVSISFREIRLEPKRAIRMSILRPEDLIMLDFEFHNFVFSNKGQGAYLQLADPKQNGTMIVFFPTQHTLEEAWFESANIPTSGKEESIELPARQVRAQKSRLVYELDAGSVGFPLMFSELLNWSKFTLRVHPRAWIKISTLFRPRPYTVLSTPSRKIKTAADPLQRPNSTLNYNIRLMNHSNMVRSNEYYAREENLNKLFVDRNSVSVRPSFSFANITKIQLKPGPVPDDCTSLEIPALMYISPNQLNDFVHRLEIKMLDKDNNPVTEKGLSVQNRVYEEQNEDQRGYITELWHTRLGVKLKDGTVSTSTLDDFRTIRVLWAYDAKEDYQYKAPFNKPFIASLDGSDRHLLVHETSNFSEKYTPVPVPVRNLMLTTLGGYFNAHVYFKLPDDYTTYLNIIEWQHLATLGRDHYVKVVREGYLFPFGHKAALVKITERKFHNESRAALNRQRMYVVILEKEVSYDRTDPNNVFIEFPFERIRIENEYTPDIDNPDASTLATFSSRRFVFKVKGAKDNEPSGNSIYNFYICVGKEKFKFDLTATDKDGFLHKFKLPLVFVENVIGRTKDYVDTIVTNYNNQADSSGLAGFDGQNVAYAACLVDGDTSFETKSITFHGQYYPAKGTADLKFHPKMHVADIYMKQVEELTGLRKPVKITLVDDENPGQVFAQVTGAIVDFTSGSDKAGGFLTPNLDISAISRLQGPLGGPLDSCKNLIFNAKDFFSSVSLPSAKIFGSIDIFSLLRVMNLGGSFDQYMTSIRNIRDEISDLKNDMLALENDAKQTGADVSSSLSAKKDQLVAKVKQLMDTISNQIPRIPNFKTYVTDDAFYAEYRWQPEMQGTDITVFPGVLEVKVSNPQTALSVTTRLEKPFDAQKSASLNGNARFENFEVDVAGMIGVGFKFLEFKSGSSQKTDVKVELNPVPIVFMGPLSFVNNLQSVIPSTGFSGDGPYINLTATGITAGYSLSIPSVQVGICTLANIALGAAVTLPFTGDPLLLSFNFCTRENPFLLTISCFGGGGFFRMVSSLHQIEIVEAAFEFGASLSLDVGVASGGVSAMGGIYFSSQATQIGGVDANIVVLTGYLRLNGHLSIIGLITVSLEFYLAFTANFITKNNRSVVNKLVGEATLKVKVEVLFFSKTVSVTVHREMQGADADPEFTDMILPEDWEAYCLAYAS